MIDDDDFYARPKGTRMERAQEIMSRAHVMRDDGGETAEQIEARHAADKAKGAVHDQYFAAEFVSLGGPLPISRKLGRQLGYDVEPADNGGTMGDSGNPDPSQAPAKDWDEE